jgi:3-phenylpropionate/trans-cinnamate dioxygenase ferredoxin subunit
MSSIDIAESNQLPPGTMKSFPIGDKIILVVNVAGQFYAINNKCTHAGGDLSPGKLEGKIVTCPKHGSKFDVTNGKPIKGPAVKDIATYKITVADKMIKIEL